MSHEEELDMPLLIYASPKIQVSTFKVLLKYHSYRLTKSPYKSTSKEEEGSEFVEFPECAQYVFTNKWNGANIQFFKYSFGNKTFISAKIRPTAFISNTDNAGILYSSTS